MASPSCRLRVAVAAVVILAGVPSAEAKPTQFRPGFNIFTPEQDVEIGRQSAAEAERQLPLLRQRNVDAYLDAIVRRLSSHAPGAKYPYQVKAVNAADVNAFALPGGFLYVNRGTIETAASEAELAGVLAHEIAHVALRHGTHQASRAYLAQAGLAVLGGAVSGRNRRSTGQIFSVLGGLGLNALFVRYSRQAETQADLAGAQMMAAAGYDPLAMASMFDKLQSMQRREPGRLERFFSDHPAAGDRAARIRQEAREIGPVSRRADVGGFERARGALGSRRPARDASLRLREPGDDRQPRTGATSVREPRIEPPSGRTRLFEQRAGFFSVEIPDNWQAASSEAGHGALIAPPGGVVNGDDGRQTVVCGLIVNHYDPFADDQPEAPSLAQATDDIARQVQQANPYLRPEGSPRRATLDGARALRVTLSGRSPATGRDEVVTLFTRDLDDGHVIYALAVAPSGETEIESAFSRMIESLRVDDRAAHR